MKKQLVLLLLTFLPLVANANTVEINGIYFNFNIEERLAEVAENPNKYAGNVIIPEKVNYGGIEYSVTGICDWGFSFCFDLTSITIPNSVTKIGSFAFNSCSGLNTVKIPNSLTNIGKGAFMNCSSLTSFTIPYGVTIIEQSTFCGCSGLTSITIPNSVTTIGYEAFKDCYGLTSVQITDIEAWCNISFSFYSNPLIYAHHLFLDGEEIKNIVIPNTISNIGNFSFQNCSGLTSVT